MLEQEGSASGLLAISCRALTPILPNAAGQTTLLKPTITVCIGPDIDN